MCLRLPSRPSLQASFHVERRRVGGPTARHTNAHERQRGEGVARRFIGACNAQGVSRHEPEARVIAGVAQDHDHAFSRLPRCIDEGLYHLGTQALRLPVRRYCDRPKR